MMNALFYIRSRRAWVVRGVQVWGLADDATLFYLGVARIEAVDRVMYDSVGIGGAAQYIEYRDLVDSRGNALPEILDSPKVIISPRTAYPSFLVGEESGSGFRIAHSNNAPGPVEVDLLIFEMGG